MARLYDQEAEEAAQAILDVLIKLDTPISSGQDGCLLVILRSYAVLAGIDPDDPTPEELANLQAHFALAKTLLQKVFEGL